MEREKAYDAEAGPLKEEAPASARPGVPLSYSYRHGDGSAEILGAELTDSAQNSVEIVESGEPLMLRIVARFRQDIDDPVIGFLIRNRNGIHAYGTNTKENQVQFGKIRSGEILEVTFAFECWLGIDQYSISLAVHSRDGEAYDWLDAALFFRVTHMTRTEGIANLHASVTTTMQVVNTAALKGEIEESLRILRA
jgi:hypothetical protein